MREPQRQICPWFWNDERRLVLIRLVHVRVGEDDVRVLAAQLERELLELRRDDALRSSRPSPSRR
jgi:hypothetical protein